MPNTPLFAGLVTDEAGKPAESAFIGNEPCYVVDDAGFKRHIPAEQVDRAVLAHGILRVPCRARDRLARCAAPHRSLRGTASP